MIKIKRVYEPFDKGDGLRILVDRLWPRGKTLQQAKIDLWLKDIAPSDTLRIWFAHDPAKWKEFKKRYSEELKGKKEAVETIKEKMREGTLTLLYGTKDTEHNNAVALKEYLSGNRS
ncbi:hypothetical protein A3I53_01130 [Candidatus Curtissbacteria bacterium RIFCSPLOWO2_02_FULL_40_13b]|uniref:MarR family transcriptional regulator n=1 Tax=Candidatus Curtissbacteria bacterium RIFCSPLOWO2_02_FULL_40_13b TaxID=1797733 RepID=A0A1F5HVS9_9BACT|nr:MAG: hypothetical protein A3I53_01130 [Candidatus Curtissbacteria bacterium RIFCSPLOWO2_02_FULL_40_13b]